MLILEDVAEDVELIVLALEAAQLEFFFHTTDSLDGFKRLLQNGPYDAILSDYRLQNFNGEQAFEILQELALDIPFVLITGSLGEEAAVECIKQGMTDYVLKDRLFRLPTVLARALEEFHLRRQQRAAILQIQQQAWRDAVIHRIVRAMRETLILSEVLQTTVDELQTALGVSRCYILQPDAQNQLWLTYINQGAPDHDHLLHRPVTCALYQQRREMLLQGQTLVLSHVEPTTCQDFEHYGFRAIMLVPLLYQQSFRGLIGLHQCDREREWTHHELALVETIAHECAIAIHQTELYEQAQTELAERQKMEAKLRHDAFHDALTGLPNRAFLMERLEYSLAMFHRRAKRYSHEAISQFAVFFLDLDRFKVINDSLGHIVGDQLLKLVAQRLNACLRVGDMVARVGGDEFVLLLEDIVDANDAIEVVQRIQESLKHPLHLEGHEVFISVSIGIAFSSSRYTQPAQLLRDADTAMYRVKGQRRGSYEIFDTSMHLQVLRQLQIENDLQRAIARHEFCLHYQPIVRLDTQQVCGFEALVRWLHPDLGLQSPADFIPIAEDTGLILAIDLWVLREACHQLSQWHREFPTATPLRMNVNLSGRQFSQPDLIDQIDQVLRETGLNGRHLNLEITESVLIENAETASKTLTHLTQQNLSVCLDDFGTGYSSLSYLRRFPIHILKIDRSFTSQLTMDGEDSEIIKAIINLGLTLGLHVVAEGIENLPQLVFLQKTRCHAGQGYYFARPMNGAQMTEWLRLHWHGDSCKTIATSHSSTEQGPR